MQHLSKSLLITFVCLLFSSHSKLYSQQPQSLAVIYKYYPYSKSNQAIYLLSIADSAMQFIVSSNDSIAKHVLAMQQKTLFHHSSFFIKDSASSYGVAKYAFAQYLIQSPYDDFIYTKTDKQKCILGYYCTKYICKTADGDRVEAWCTDSIGNYYSKIHAPGAPGVVLEMKFHSGKKDFDLFYKAITLNLVNSPVIFPDREVVLSQEGAKNYHSGNFNLSELNINPKAIIRPEKNKPYPQPNN